MWREEGSGVLKWNSSIPAETVIWANHWASLGP